MLKPYNELRKVDISKYVKERDGMKYLPYNECIALLHEHGAEEAYFTPIPNPRNGTSVYETDTVFTDKNGNTNRCYETRIEIHIDGKVYYMQSPVMNGINAVKDNSMSQQKVYNSTTRSFVKGVAIYTGLGFSLWLEEEENERKLQQEAEYYHDINKVKERVFETVTAIQKRGNLSLAEIAQKMSKTEEELKMYLNYYKILGAVEHNLNYILKGLS